MTLRSKLTLAFAVFAAVPVTAALWPVSRALSQALEAEYGARLDQAARAVQGEYRRVAGEAAAAAQEVARSGEVDALLRDRDLPGFDPADAAERAAGWMRTRGLDALAVTDASARVLASGHLPGRAGDVDPELKALFAGAPPAHGVPREMARATADGVEPGLVAVAWAPVPGAEPPLRVAAGFALGEEFAERLTALTGGEVVVRPLARAAATSAAPRGRGGGELWQRLVGFTRSRTREVPIPAASAPIATISVTLPASGLARAQTTVALALLMALAAAVVAATLAGRAVAERVTRPVEALRAGAQRVAAGELGTQVEARASGELGELVRVFNAMTTDLARTTERAVAAERVAAWQEVARRLAHEVKNPLTPVAMSVETLRDAWSRRRPDFGEIFDEGTRAIGEEVRRLARIVDEFGRFARLPAPNPTPVGADELVQAALALYPERAQEVSVEREVEAELPALSADRDQIAQVLHNLVRNALDAVGARGHVRVRAFLDGERVAISVADDGPGIAPRDLERVFEPYFTTKGGGTGLGLAIARRIAREHGGELDVVSRPGQGATFTLRLPIAGRVRPAGGVSAPGSP